MLQEIMRSGAQRRRGLAPLTALGTLLLLSMALLFSWQSARAFGESDWKGRVEALPTSGLIGEWTVAGRLFVTTAGTEFDTDKGNFALGSCVEVEYVGTAAPFQATKLATKSSDDCRANGTPTAPQTPDPNATPGATSSVTPSVTPAVSPTDDGNSEDQRGVIDSLPSSGLIGSWTISGVAYEVTAATRLRQDGAPFVIGACVEVHYQAGTTPRLAQRIETKRGRDCGAQPTPGATPDPSSTPNGDQNREIYGLVESLPAGLIGSWTIRGQQYTATAATEFDQEHGDFAVGVCVKAHLNSDGVTIREIETSHGFRCGSADDSGTNARGELYGIIQSFPTTLTGDWNIGGITVLADSNTEFNQRNGSFAVGMTVKVHFQVQSDGSFYATEIESKFASGHDDNGHGDDDGHRGRDGHAFGLIDSVPANLLGSWSISGISYTVNSTTTLVPATGNFAVGQQVRINYYTDANQQRVARQIKLSSEDNGADDRSHATLFGYVEQMPPSGFVGEWIVGGTTFTATGTTRFNENDGLLGLGAYVKMEYFIRAGVNILHEIEVAVPPGTGDNNRIGRIDDNGGNGSALQAAGLHATTWVIDGVSYTVTPATDLNDLQGALTAGETALVNSYTATDGSQVATEIRSITLDNQLFLPLLSR